MCIRDSNNPVKFRQSGDILIIYTENRKFTEKNNKISIIYRAVNPRYLYHTCLLYTSDAADERSSVDLGGRRILKKKKIKKQKKKKKKHKKKNKQHYNVVEEMRDE